MFFLYEILLHIVLAIGFPVLLLRPRFRERLNERTGEWSPMVYERLRGGPIVWVHCASVGEVQAARPLLKVLIERYAQHRFLITTMTTTGAKQAETVFGKQAVVALLPLDSRLFLNRVLRNIQPRTVLIFETELWPQFLRLTRNLGARIVLVNGRISARSFPRYQLIRSFIAGLLERFDLFLMSGNDNADRLLALGALADRVRTLGNVKWAGTGAPISPKPVPGWPAEALVFVAGSTHAGEEDMVLQAFEDLLQYKPEAKLILAPRHPQRTADVEKILRQRGVTFAKRTSNTANTPAVYLVDTVGELTSFFPLARAVFLGGSFVPIGGHNVLEPAQAGVPVFYGQHMENFSEIAGALEKKGGSIQVADWRELASQWRALSADASRAKRMGAEGRKLVDENAAILQSYVQALAEVMA